jgi:hypothetical protein
MLLNLPLSKRRNGVTWPLHSVALNQLIRPGISGTYTTLLSVTAVSKRSRLTNDRNPRQKVPNRYRVARLRRRVRVVACRSRGATSLSAHCLQKGLNPISGQTNWYNKFTSEDANKRPLGTCAKPWRCLLILAVFILFNPHSNILTRYTLLPRDDWHNGFKQWSSG